MAQSRKIGECPAGYHYIYVCSYFNKRLGRRVHASEYGKKCFVFCVPLGSKPKGVPTP